MSKPNNYEGENKFSEMEYMNITVVTSNKPYGISDGSNPLINGPNVPKFNLEKGGVHSGHIQQGLRDPLCFVKNGKGKCQDGYTKEVHGPDSVRVLVATKGKPNRYVGSSLDRGYFINFLNVLKQQQQAGRYNFTTQFPYYKECLFKLSTLRQSL
ncbi:Nucleoside hydrolase 3 [Trifolium repens]|nr:Nucleoside hydrolase 3 [Trifolium repens]